MVKHPLVDARAFRNGIHAGTGKTVRGKFFEGGGQNEAARALRIARRGTANGLGGLGQFHADK
jgi:arabinogalactan endo-1,4-beta-galactosidase